MRKNDLLILNNTRVFPARLFATKDRTDAKVEVFLLTGAISRFMGSNGKASKKGANWQQTCFYT